MDLSNDLMSLLA